MFTFRLLFLKFLSCFLFLIISHYVHTLQPFRPNVYYGLIGARAVVYPTAGLNTTWIASASAANYFRLPLANVSAIPLLLRNDNGLQFTCGFYSQGDLEVYYFAFFISPTISIVNFSPTVVWSANWNRPVGTRATLELTIWY
ncbi:hypothetical protein NL676_001056 [Syzygium grande]|nr:hypothetical protein NL676_001056 [Syzygium grande]